MNFEPQEQCEPESASHLAGLANRIREGRKTASQSEYEATPPKLSIAHRRTAAEGVNLLSLPSIIRFAFGAATRTVMCPPLQIELDGEIVATIEEGQKFELVTTAGSHHLRVLSTVGSSSRDLELTNGQRLRFWCLNSISGVVFQRED